MSSAVAVHWNGCGSRAVAVHRAELQAALLGAAGEVRFDVNVGQGAAMAIEDAVALSAEPSGGDDLRSQLERYESSRRPRAELVLKLSLRPDSAAQLTSPLGRRLRNLLVRRTPSRLQARQLEPIVHHQLP
jgi:hypothetical protein